MSHIAHPSPLCEKEPCGRWNTVRHTVGRFPTVEHVQGTVPAKRARQEFWACSKLWPCADGQRRTARARYEDGIRKPNPLPALYMPVRVAWGWEFCLWLCCGRDNSAATVTVIQTNELIVPVKTTVTVTVPELDLGLTIICGIILLFFFILIVQKPCRIGLHDPKLQFPKVKKLEDIVGNVFVCSRCEKDLN